MAEVRQIQPGEWKKVKPLAMELVRGHRDGHITRKAFAHMQQMRSRNLEQAGTVVWSAWDKRKLVGIMVFERYGNRTSMVVVHRDYRGQGISRDMMLQAVRQMGRFYAEIASDNLSSLRSVFWAGMVAYDVFVRRGKVTLRVRNGFDPAKTAENSRG